jgi:hypothetical protein
MYRMVRSILEGKQDILPPDSEDILSGKRGMMCQYDKALHFETLWSVIYALGTLGNTESGRESQEEAVSLRSTAELGLE